MKKSLMLAAVASFLMCGSAEAVTYSLASPYEGVDFTFDYPNGHITTEQFITNFTTNGDVQSAQFCFAGETCGPFGANYMPKAEGIYVSSGGGSIVINGQTVQSASVGVIFDFPNGTFENDGVYSAISVTGQSHTGVLSVGAVPEPASWAMMILGMGAVGYAMRRRKITTLVQFA